MLAERIHPCDIYGTLNKSHDQQDLFTFWRWWEEEKSFIRFCFTSSDILMTDEVKANMNKHNTFKQIIRTSLMSTCY